MSVSARDGGLDELARRNPEWAVWLDLLRAARAELGGPAWQAAVPEGPVASAGAVLLDGAELRVERGVVQRWVVRLLTTAARHPGAESLAAAARGSALDGCAVLEASIVGDPARLEAAARAAGAAPGAFASVASVAAMPLLHACARRWTPLVPAGWDRGFCPVCGAWPALAEARGLERARRLRCGRCAADWRFAWLRCPYCGNADHAALGALVPERDGERRKADTCAVCRRYVKTVTTLLATPPADVAVEDLATVDLDVAALGQGYGAAEGLGAAPSVRVMPRPRRGLLAAWR